MRSSYNLLQEIVIPFPHFYTRKKGAAATIRINEQLPSLREMTAHSRPRTSRVYNIIRWNSFQIVSSAMVGGFQKDAEWKASRDRNESSVTRTIEISFERRIDTGKIIPSVRNNCYYSQVDDEESTGIATTLRIGGRWEAVSGKWSEERERERQRDSSKTWTHDDGWRII